nr:beta-1,4-glucosidase [Aspergillus niger CBS 513.88]|eukprot:XP_001389473.2 beta-1,4-glucosidase [Aspergillus niger CBS 513.88]
MPSTPEPASPQSTNSKRLDRDDRIRVLTLRDAGFTYQQIVDQLQISYRQVQYTCQNQQATPRKAKGNTSKLSDEEVDHIIQWISSSKRYTRCKALRKPPLTSANKQARLAWAFEHLYWTRDQWNRILWTDETWVTSGFHKQIYVTRKAGEELDKTCLRTNPPRKRGWMFWASFYNNFKGPCLFWEKEWGTINAEGYIDRIVPIIDGYVRLVERNEHQRLQIMQDNAPGHASKTTIQEFNERGIFPIIWPAFSPDLNPIEAVWNWMKDWIERYFPQDEQLSYDQLREVVRAAWDALPEAFLDGLINSMPARCQAVINAEGGHTKY